MAAKALITRRAALVGALASSAALALPAVAAVTVKKTKTQIDNDLCVLTREFIKAAKALDPSIKGAWIGNDVTRYHRGKVHAVYFERKLTKVYLEAKRIQAANNI